MTLNHREERAGATDFQRWMALVVGLVAICGAVAGATLFAATKASTEYVDAEVDKERQLALEGDEKLSRSLAEMVKESASAQRRNEDLHREILSEFAEQRVLVERAANASEEARAAVKRIEERPR